MPYLIVEHDNIRRWPDSVDPSTYLAEFTGLITDYSSILYDYIFVQSRGAILYTFDFEDYVAKDRSLLFPFDENVAGLRVVTFDALCAALRDGDAFDAAFTADVARVRDRFWGGSPSPASAAIVNYVERTLSDRSRKATIQTGRLKQTRSASLISPRPFPYDS